MFLLLIHVLSLFYVQGQNNPACDTGVFHQCVYNSSEPWVQDLTQGKLSVIGTLDIDYACNALENIYYCIGDSMSNCSYGLTYVLVTALSAARYVCNQGKPGFTRNAQCFANHALLSRVEGCTTNLFNSFPNIYEISLDTQRDQLCGLFDTWSKCMSNSVNLMCDEASLMYIYSLIEATLRPSRYMLLCDIGTKSCLSSPCQNGGVCLSTFGLNYTCQCIGNYHGRHCQYIDNGTTTRQPTSEPFNTTTTTPTTDSCDIPGTMRCLSMVKPELANFFTMIGQASGQNLKEFCWSLDNVYTCIGRKLDNCSPELQLMRDFVVSAGRYICNTDSQVLARNIDCIQMLSNINLTIHCMDDSRDDMAQFFTGVKSVFTYTDEFCSLSSNWTQCYMRTVERRCTSESYIYMYNYMKYAAKPVKQALQCDIMSGVQVMNPSPEPTYVVVVSNVTSGVMTTSKDHCASSPCFYGATCISESEDFRCICPPNLFGRRCGVGVGGCPGFPCYNGGSCYTDDSGTKCLCPNVAQGPHCEGTETSVVPEPEPSYPETTPYVTPEPTGPAVNPCDSSPCFFGATCLSEFDDFKCVCPSGLYGRRCDVGNGGCPGFPCYNGGTCFADDSGSRCLCPDAYPGVHCEGSNPQPESTTESSFPTTTGIDHCASSPCYHGASCISEYNDFRCICPPKLFGRRCGVGVDGCPGFPCYNGGSCYTDESGSRCLCPDQYPGMHCEGTSQLTTTTEATTTTSTTTESSIKKCWYTGSQRTQKGRWNRWCTDNCNRGYCPSDYCTCDSRPPVLRCFAVGQNRGNPGMNDWCNNNCTPSYCPRQFCRCRRNGIGG